MRDNYPTRSSANKMDPMNNDNFDQFNAQNSLKRPASLDLNQEAKALGRKAKFSHTVNTTLAASVLSTPDLQACKFSTPDLEILANIPGILQTPTTTASVAYGTNATSEQEDYARGFEEALKSLKNKENSVVTNTNIASNTVTVNSTIPTTAVSMISGGMSGGTISYTNLDDSLITVKDEPQSISNSPPHSPIDMESQERIKLERKRQRNRVAASKCRKRKLERISKLEDRVKCLKGENCELASVVKQLKENVCQLKQQVIDHVQTGCNIPLYNASLFPQATTA